MSRLLTRGMVLPAAYALRGEWPFGVRADLERSQWFTPGQLRELQWRKLQRILAAARGTGFHRRRMERAGLDRIDDFDDFGRLPPMEKNDVRDLAAELAPGAGRRRDVHARKTAGTSGVPLRVLADGTAGAHVHAARMRALAWYGIRPGDRELRCWGRPSPSGGSAAALYAALLNRRMIHPADLVPPAVDALLRSLGRSRADYAYGYSTMLSDLADAAVDRGLRPDRWGLKAVVCTAESILAPEQRRLAGLFGCPVLAEYGCSEVDIISFECPAGGHHLMSENVLVEVEPEPGGDGRTGEILVTDLNNAFMPLLRYRLGDVVTLADGACSCGRGLPLLKEVHGRNRERYLVTPAGRKIHSAIFPYAVVGLMESGVDIRRYFVVQEAADRVRVLIVLAPGAGDDLKLRIERSIVEGTAGDLKGEIACTVEFPESVPANLERKFTCFVPYLPDSDPDDTQEGER